MCLVGMLGKGFGLRCPALHQQSKSMQGLLKTVVPLALTQGMQVGTDVIPVALLNAPAEYLSLVTLMTAWDVWWEWLAHVFFQRRAKNARHTCPHHTQCRHSRTQHQYWTSMVCAGALVQQALL